MKTRSIFKPWLTLWLATLFTLGGPGAARAAENHTGAWGLISSMGSATIPFDAIWLVTGDPADPFVHNNLIYVNMDMQYNYPSYEMWESATWRPANSYPTQRFTASLLGTDEYTQPIGSRYIQLRNLTLERTDLDTQNVQFRFSPFSTPAGDTSLTLNNSSLTGEAPGYNANAHFTLTASGDSRIAEWGNSQVFSQTTLNVTPGSVLNLFRVAFNHSTLPTNSWYFNHSGNVATIDGGTLKLDQSYVTFGRTALFPGETYGQMTFQNNALLELTGEAAQLDSGYFNFNHSSLNVGVETRLRARAELNLDTAAVTVGSAGEIQTDILKAGGASTMALPTELDARFKSVTAGLLQIEPGAVLGLNGNGSLAVTSKLIFSLPGAGQSYGRIDVNDKANLLLAGAFTISPGDIININRTSDAIFGLVSVENGGVIEYLGIAPPGTNHLTNHGTIGAANDGTFYVPGHATLLGGSEGILDIADEGTLDIGSGALTRAQNSLTTDNEVFLENFSTLVLTLDPTNQRNDKLNVGPTSGSGSILYIDPFADLSLELVNDKPLNIGDKFRLVNYASLHSSPPNHGAFNGYPNGHIFSLGLNAYQINYADTADPGYANAITLTVVGNPALSPAVQQVAGVAGLPLTPTSALTPLNFDAGCVLAYTSPPLPPNLSLDPSTGVISGTPLAAQTAANITITGTGTGACSSQSASATVTLTVAATQTITFGPAPTPTFAPNGTFVVSATATSLGTVSYSSQTPLVCTTNGGSTITMLGAGTCTIAANQPGNANWAPAPQVTQDITIAPGAQAALVLSASPTTVAVNGTSQLQTTGGSGTGKVSYSRLSGPCTLVDNTLTGTAVGNCVFTATKAADSNYTETTSAPVTVIVTAVPLTVSYPSIPLVIGKPGYLQPVVTGDMGTMTYSLLSGVLPAGLTLDPATGDIHGIPEGPEGKFDLAIKATDGTSTVVETVTITIQKDPVPIPSLSEWSSMILASLMMLMVGWHLWSRRPH